MKAVFCREQAESPLNYTPAYIFFLIKLNCPATHPINISRWVLYFAVNKHELWFVCYYQSSSVSNVPLYPWFIRSKYHSPRSLAVFRSLMSDNPVTRGPNSFFHTRSPVLWPPVRTTSVTFNVVQTSTFPILFQNTTQFALKFCQAHTIKYFLIWRLQKHFKMGHDTMHAASPP